MSSVQPPSSHPESPPVVRTGIAPSTPPASTPVSHVALNALSRSSSEATSSKPIRATTNIGWIQWLCEKISYLFSCCFRSKAKVQPELKMQDQPIHRPIVFSGAKLDLSKEVRTAVDSTLRDTPKMVSKDYTLPSVAYYDLRRCEHLEIGVNGNDLKVSSPKDDEMIRFREDVSKAIGPQGKQVYDNVIVLSSQGSSAEIAARLMQNFPSDQYQTPNIASRDLEAENQMRSTQYRRIDVDRNTVRAVNLQLFKVASILRPDQKAFVVAIDKTVGPFDILSSDLANANLSTVSHEVELSSAFASEKEALDFMESHLQQLRKTAAQESRPRNPSKFI